MANSIKININGLSNFTIDIGLCPPVRDSKYDKIYPLPCSCAKLKLRRSYKAICKFCSSITSTYNKNRIGICPACERNITKNKEHKVWTTCYICNQNDYNFKKTKKGFVCEDCYSTVEFRDSTVEPREKSFCPICEYEVFTHKKGIHICDYCKTGNIRKPRLLREKKVLCCNCEQVTIQLNPNNENVYCSECKYELFGSTYIFGQV